MLSVEPQIKGHLNYYDKFIRPTANSPRLSMASFDDWKRSAANSVNTFKSPPQTTRNTDDYVPLKDLLRKGHDDRVKDYLERMKNLSIDEIVYTNAGMSDAPPTTARQRKIV